jgi:oligopeptidase B
MIEKKVVLKLIYFGLLLVSMRLYGLPETDKKEFFLELHGDKLRDDYHWLQEKNNAEVMFYISQENLYADSIMAETQELQDQLLTEFYSFEEKSSNIVYKEVGNVKYFDKWETGGFRNVYQKKGRKETKILDMEKISNGHRSASLIVWNISPNNQYLAYLVNFNGDHIGTLFIKDLYSMEEPADSLYGVSFMYAWATDSNLFYVTLEFPVKYNKLYNHKIGTDYSEDKLVYENESETGKMELIETDQYIQYVSSDKEQSEAWYIDRNKPLSQFQPMFPKRPNTYTYTIYNNTVIMYDNNQLFSFPVNEPDKITLIKQFDESTYLYDFIIICNNYLIIFEENDGYQKINCYDVEKKQDYYLQFPDKSYSISKIGTGDFSRDFFDFTYSSLHIPETTYRFDIKKKKMSILSQLSFKNYDENDYQSEKVFINSHDGKQIPVSLFYKKSLMKKDGSNPLLLTAFGAYGFSQHPKFQHQLIASLNRGFIYAIAHVRGGHEMGTQWHNDSIGSFKKNTVLDFISVSEELIQQKYTSSNKLAIMGKGAGGRLINSVLNYKPSLYAVAVSELPACDGVNWLLENNQNALIHQTEFGNPMVHSDYLNCLEWDPYQTIKKQNYPPMLISTKWNDTFIGYWQALKLTAKLRDMKQDQNLLLLKTEFDGDYWRYSSINKYYEIWAYQYAFILKCLGMK